MRIRTSRAALGSVAVAMLTLALMAPTALAGNGNGNGHGNGNGNGASQGQGQGHGKPAGVGRSGAPGQQKKAENQANQQNKAKKEKKAKQEKKAKEAKAKSLAMAPCKNGGWQTLQASDGAPFTNQGRCVSYAVHGGVLEPLATEEEPVIPVEEPAAPAPEPQGGANYLASLPCKDGGWQTQQREDGTRFDNQGGCVSYAVRGGILAAVVPVVTITFAPNLVDPLLCDATGTIGDFDLSTEYVGDLTVDAVPTGVVAITTDALGDGSVALEGPFAPGQVLSVTVDGVASGDTVVVCPPEVEAP